MGLYCSNAITNATNNSGYLVLSATQMGQTITTVLRHQSHGCTNSSSRQSDLTGVGVSNPRYTTSAQQPLYYGGLMAPQAQQLGLEQIAWAQGIGPLKRPFTRAFERHVCWVYSRKLCPRRGSAES